MKYIITEDRLESVIFNFLNSKLSGIKKLNGENYDIVFTFPNKKYGLLGWKQPCDLYVFYTLTNEIEDVFGIKRSDALYVIGRYVAGKYNLEVKTAMESWIRDII